MKRPVSVACARGLGGNRWGSRAAVGDAHCPVITGPGGCRVGSNYSIRSVGLASQSGNSAGGGRGRTAHQSREQRRPGDGHFVLFRRAERRPMHCAHVPATQAQMYLHAHTHARTHARAHTQASTQAHTHASMCAPTHPPTYKPTQRYKHTGNKGQSRDSLGSVTPSPLGPFSY